MDEDRRRLWCDTFAVVLKEHIANIVEPSGTTALMAWACAVADRSLQEFDARFGK